MALGKGRSWAGSSPSFLPSLEALVYPGWWLVTAGSLVVEAVAAGASLFASNRGTCMHIPRTPASLPEPWWSPAWAKEAVTSPSTDPTQLQPLLPLCLQLGPNPALNSYGVSSQMGLWNETVRSCPISSGIPWHLLGSLAAHPHPPPQPLCLSHSW